MILMNRIVPTLFQEAFTSWVRDTWPERSEFVAIDGKTSRRTHDRPTGEPPLHLVSAFATTSRLVLGQEAVADKSNELTAIPVLLAWLAEADRLRGALVSIDAVATNRTNAAARRLRRPHDSLRSHRTAGVKLPREWISGKRGGLPLLIVRERFKE